MLPPSRSGVSSLEFLFEIQEVETCGRPRESRSGTLEGCALGRTNRVDARRCSRAMGPAKKAKGKGRSGRCSRPTEMERENAGRTKRNYEAGAKGPRGFQKDEVIYLIGNALQFRLQSLLRLLYDSRKWQASQPSIGRS